MVKFSHYTSDELEVMIEACQEDIAAADAVSDAVMGHDLRCGLDQMVDELEKQRAEAQALPD